MAGNFRALIFDVDGTVADTERDGHRVAYNGAFERMGLTIRWDEHTYGNYLKVAGGKERLRYLVTQPDFERNIEDVDNFVEALYREKVRIYMDILESGHLPVRSGIIRLIEEAHRQGIRLGIASSSNEKAVTALIKHLFGDRLYSWFDVILAGDVVSRKKPDPEIYNLVKEKMNLNGEDCCVVEDNHNGYLASRNAGMKTVITTNEYTENEDFASAELVVNELGDPGCAPVKIAQCIMDLGNPSYITIDHIAQLYD